MGEGFKKGVGGANPLNFKVIGGTTEPTNPKENTIWVNTDKKITGRYFSATQPENMAEGEVWFLVGAASDVAFSATKKNPVMVYPLSAKQKIDSALVDVTAKSYQNGEWVDWWNGELYDSGDEFESVTGGWIAQAVPMDTGGESYKLSITKGSSSMTIKSNPSGGGIARTNNKVDITKYKSLKFNGSVTTGTGGHDWWFDFVVWSKIGSDYTQNVAAYKCLEDSNGKSGTFTIDVSALNGEYYIGFAMYADADQKVVVKKMWLE